MRGVLGFVVDIRVGLGGVIGKIGGTRTPVVAELALGFIAAEPPEAHVHGFHFFVMMVLLARPSAVVLSVWMGDWGCSHPISMRDWRSGTISLAQMKRVVSSDSAAEDVMNLMICVRVMMGPL